MKIFFAKATDKFRGFLAVQLDRREMTKFNMVHNIRKRLVDKYAHGFYPFRQGQANFPGLVVGQMPRAFWIKNASDGIRPKCSTLQGLFNRGQATYLDLRYKFIFVHGLLSKAFMGELQNIE